MDRVEIAADLLAACRPKILLDVGCRDGRLRSFLDNTVTYVGCDLTPGENVSIVGDVTKLDLRGGYEAVVALDILEHVDGAHELFDRLAGWATRTLVVSLPNCYDLKGRVKFALAGRLGGKYSFGVAPRLDRHRWIMGHEEIMTFFKFMADRHQMRLRTFNVRYGDLRARRLTSLIGVCSRILGPRLTTETVIGVFERD